jgi:hypothetical protein
MGKTPYLGHPVDNLFVFKQKYCPENFYKKGVIPDVILLMGFPVIHPCFFTLCFFSAPDIFGQVPLHLLA